MVKLKCTRYQSWCTDTFECNCTYFICHICTNFYQSCTKSVQLERFRIFRYVKVQNIVFKRNFTTYITSKKSMRIYKSADILQQYWEGKVHENQQEIDWQFGTHKHIHTHTQQYIEYMFALLTKTLKRTINIETLRHWFRKKENLRAGV